MRLVFNKENKDIFTAISSGDKKVETRAATSKYKNIEKGDSIIFSCDGESFEKKASKVTHFKTIKELLKVYKPQDINPNVSTENDLVAMYHSFPGYEDKIKEFKNYCNKQ
jgi:ASC-1-like (ASCH) protein